MECALPFDDVDDLVIDVAMGRNPARIDDAEELREVVITDLLVGEVLEAPLLSCGKRRTVGSTNRALLGRRVDPVLLVDADGDDDELLGPRVVDLEALAGCDVGAHVRLELVLASLDDQ